MHKTKSKAKSKAEQKKELVAMIEESVPDIIESLLGIGFHSLQENLKRSGPGRFN